MTFARRVTRTATIWWLTGRVTSSSFTDRPVVADPVEGGGLVEAAELPKPTCRPGADLSLPSQLEKPTGAKGPGEERRVGPTKVVLDGQPTCCGPLGEGKRSPRSTPTTLSPRWAKPSLKAGRR